jgi:REP element-mobilizing transposase RayT
MEKRTCHKNIETAVPRHARNNTIAQCHVIIARANGGVALFYEHQDYEAYLRNLRQMVRDKFLKLYAYCLQPEEIRLVMKPVKIPLARVMQRLHGRHTLRMNGRLGRHGHLFHGRFDSICLPENYLANAVRSVHLWPVRSGVNRRMDAYPYSSFSAYANNDSDFFDVVEANEVLSNFGANVQVARRAFFRFMEAAVLDDDDYGVPKSALTRLRKAQGGVRETAAGASDPLLKRLRKQSFDSLARRVSMLLGISIAAMVCKSRRQDLVMARRLFATVAVLGALKSISDVARFLQRDKAQISRLVSQGIDLVDSDEPFRTLYVSFLGKGEALFAQNNPQKEPKI